MKKQYTIPTPYGTVERKSEREYTHIVVSNGWKAEGNERRLTIRGFCNGEARARKVASGWESKEQVGVLIIEITPEMVREIQPSKSKV